MTIENIVGRLYVLDKSSFHQQTSKDLQLSKQSTVHISNSTPTSTLWHCRLPPFSKCTQACTSS